MRPVCLSASSLFNDLDSSGDAVTQTRTGPGIPVAPRRKETLLTLKDNVFIWNTFHLLFKCSLEQSIYSFI